MRPGIKELLEEVRGYSNNMVDAGSIVKVEGGYIVVTFLDHDGMRGGFKGVFKTKEAAESWLEDLKSITY